jgi:RluA family pseudouridine synthase
MWDIPVIYEDKYLLVVNKPQGIVVEPDHDGHENVVEVLQLKYKDKLRGNNIIQNAHRLDRPVSGTLLLARKPSILKQFNAQFAAHHVRKTYLAIVGTAPPAAEGTLVHWLIKDNPAKRAIVSDKKVKGAVEATLKYKIKAESAGKVLLEIDLITGKYHQIRAQLAHIGSPIIGDAKYGSLVIYRDNAITLHASALSFLHPIEHKPLTIHAPTPIDAWWDLFR